ncbi:MAG: CHRD domain-containing protein [Verrucomicrobiales bacterium]
MKLKMFILAALAVGGLTWFAGSASAQGFGDRFVQLRGLATEELIKPEIPDDAVATPEGFTYRPLYLVKRYYSCSPWLLSHVRSVRTSAVGFTPADVVIDTGDDNPELQLVNEQNEQRLGFNPGTVVHHPGYGLYCLSIRICVNWDQWALGGYHRFFVRFHHRCPYICWWDHWWHYYRSPRYAFQVTLSGSQEVPPNASPATGTGLLHLDPVYRTLGYDINYGGLGSNFSAAHIHGPAPSGVNAGVQFALTNIPFGPNAGRLNGSTAALTATQQNDLRNGQYYVNIHTAQFPGGEIRGQIQPVPFPVYCPWRPAWIPFWTWGRGGNLWCLTLTHPYGYGWDPYYRWRPFCIYGLRYYFTPIGALQNPAALPYIGRLNSTLTAPWLHYPYRPFYRYWPYTPYCSRWYWFTSPSFSLYRHLPPCVQYATYVNPDLTDPAVNQPFPDDPVPMPGTTGVTTLRALVSQQGDLTGDGVVSLADLSAFKAEQGSPNQDTADVDEAVPGN